MKTPHFSVLLPVLLAGAALAQDSASPLRLTLTQALVQTVTVNGQPTERRNPAPPEVAPGDVLAQTLSARNVSTRALAGVALRLPVPANTVYLAPDGALPEGVRVEYSIDGGRTFAPAPLTRRVTVTEGGRTVTREVPVLPNEYQAVRWTVQSLPAGTEARLGFRVRVR